MHVSIRIKGHLDLSWQDYLEGLEIVYEADGTSRLSGMLQDQSALYGVLKMMSHLSLTLLSLENSEIAQKERSLILLFEQSFSRDWRQWGSAFLTRAPLVSSG